VKKASPSAGVIAADFNPLSQAREYARGGAHALSILTDEKYFHGSLAYLRQVREQVELPLLRKDFIVHELQVYESVVAGADAILLIVASLDDGPLRALYDCAKTCQLDVLVEVHDLREMDRALELGADLIGINNRNLKTFQVDLATTEELAEEIPNDAVGVSESGIRTVEDVRRVRAAGISAVLVGETLMRAKNVPEKLRELMLKD
jgi:indole-3-glycerol phosphate synthase